MANGIGTVHVRMQRGKVVVQGDGKTPRGQRFIKQTTVLKASSMSSPGVKSEIAAAVSEMLAQRALPL